MSFSVLPGPSLDALPADLRGEILLVLQQVADAISTIPSSNVFWASAPDSVMQIDVGSMRVLYSVDPHAGTLRIIEVAAIRR